MQYALAYLAAGLFCWFLLPNELPDQAFIYQRYSVHVMLALVVIASLLVPGRIAPAAVAAGGLAVCVLTGALWADYFRDFRLETADFTPDILPPGGHRAVLAGMVFSIRFRGHPTVPHLPSYYIVWRQGISTMHFADARFGNVRRKVGFAELPRNMDYLSNYYDLPRSELPAVDHYDGRFRNVEYLLVRGLIPDEIRPQFVQFVPVRSQGTWTLFRNVERTRPEDVAALAASPATGEAGVSRIRS